MSDGPVISIEGLGKRYRLGHVVDLRRTFGETLMAMPGAMARRAREKMRRRNEEGEDFIWALRDVSLEAHEGEVLGIIGPNGAGKSTLLKILTRVTSPTVGRARLRGRVGALLEVGTGMHMELTGRQNIYLNGAALGMRKAEISRKFDEILAFAEVEKFVDTPVKRYSSGMRVRLGFAVAAHLETEILIVDEVLAVGDADFQKRCLGKMQNIAQSGRTVLFVSHSMQSVRRLCTRGVMIEGGRVTMTGDTEKAIEAYLSTRGDENADMQGDIPPERHAVFPPPIELFRIEMLGRDGAAKTTLSIEELFTLRLYYRLREPEGKYYLILRFHLSDGTCVAVLKSREAFAEPIGGRGGVDYSIDIALKNILLPGGYYLEVWVARSGAGRVDEFRWLSFDVEPMLADPSRRYSPRGAAGGGGYAWLESKWEEPRELPSATRRGENK